MQAIRYALSSLEMSSLCLYSLLYLKYVCKVCIPNACNITFEDNAKYNTCHIIMILVTKYLFPVYVSRSREYHIFELCLLVNDEI